MYIFLSKHKLWSFSLVCRHKQSTKKEYMIVLILRSRSAKYHERWSDQARLLFANVAREQLTKLWPQKTVMSLDDILNQRPILDLNVSGGAYEAAQRIHEVREREEHYESFVSRGEIDTVALQSMCQTMFCFIFLPLRCYKHSGPQDTEVRSKMSTLVLDTDACVSPPTW